MILVTKKDKPFTYSGKGTPRRKAIVTDYETEIEELYRTAEDTAINGLTIQRVGHRKTPEHTLGPSSLVLC